MARYIPSLKGWIAALSVALTLLIVPEIFPARVDGHSSPAVPTGIWMIGAGFILVCNVASSFAMVRGSGPDKVAGALAGTATLLMSVMYIRAALV